MSTVFSDLALKALLYEVAVSPKPGLVDRYNSGAHKDMDFFTFIDSSVALKHYFYEIEHKTRALSGGGIVDAEQLFNEISPLGLMAEDRMYESTKGINTHKGAIYALGLNLAAACEVYKTSPDESSEHKVRHMRQRISEYVTPSVQRHLKDLKRDSKMTYGLDQYLKYGLLGARGEAVSGYPAVFEVGLPVLNAALQEGLSLNDAAIEVLLKLITLIDDSNVIGRRGLEILKDSQHYAAAVLKHGAMRTVRGREQLLAYDAWCIQENVSHGGAADLMAVVLFHHFIHEKYHSV